ncbi:hypothetical protein C100_01155 [Sphingobium sp. C100]|nr:hypothetical protein C100_01155 [Sphingobium sp. C100]
MIVAYWMDVINPFVMFSTIFFLGGFFAFIEYKRRR